MFGYLRKRKKNERNKRERKKREKKKDEERKNSEKNKTYEAIQGHPPELSDSVKLLLLHAKRHGFEINQVLKSID